MKISRRKSEQGTVSSEQVPGFSSFPCASVGMHNHVDEIIQIISNPKLVGAGPRACPVNKINRQPHAMGQPPVIAPTDVFRFCAPV